MTAIIVWSIIILWLVIGFKRQSIYFQRSREANLKRYTCLYDGEEGKARLNKEAAWVSLGMALGWGWYELAVFYRDNVIKYMTREERQLEEYEKAKKIVDSWETQKKLEFDKQLKGY